MCRRAALLAGTLLALALGGAAAGEPASPAAACGLCPAIVAQVAGEADQALALTDCLALVGQQAELGGLRAAFLARPRYSDLFPTIYWHVTDIDFRRLAAGDFALPIETMDEVLAFYDAYQVNRLAWETGGAMEPHWARAYRLAEAADEDFGAIGQGSVMDTPEAVRTVLLAAMSAHIDYDLPRVIRGTFQPRPGRVWEPDQLQADFFATDATINASMASAGEIFAAIQATSTWRKSLLGDANLDLMRDVLAETNQQVLDMRHRAWEVARAPGPLPTGAAPQPPSGRNRLAALGRSLCPSI
jgi:hypothetical protein